MGCTLHQHGHTHSMGGSIGHHHDSSDQLPLDEAHVEAQQHQHSVNINVRAAYVHVLGDLVQSLGVLLAAIVIFYKASH